MHIDKNTTTISGVGNGEGTSPSPSPVMPEAHTDPINAGNQTVDRNTFHPQTVSQFTENAGRARTNNCTSSNTTENAESEKLRLNEFTRAVLEFDKAGIREFAHPQRGHLYVICTYEREYNDALARDLKSIDEGIKNLDIFKICPDIKERIRTEGGGRIEPLQVFDPGRLTTIEALNLPAIEPFVDIQYIVRRIDDGLTNGNQSTAATKTPTPKPPTNNTTSIPAAPLPIVALQAPAKNTTPVVTPSPAKPTTTATTTSKVNEVKHISILDREINTFEDYVAVVYGLDIALSKIEKASNEFIEILEHYLKTYPDLIKLIEEFDHNRIKTKVSLKVSGKGCFETAATLPPFEKKLNELTKAIDFYCALTSKIADPVDEDSVPKDKKDRSHFVVHKQWSPSNPWFKLSDGVCKLLGDQEKAHQIFLSKRLEDYISLQKSERKIMPYTYTFRPAIARLAYYEELFQREKEYLLTGLDLREVNEGLKKCTDDDLIKILTNFIPRLKRYFCEKISPTDEKRDPTQFLKICVLELSIRMPNDFGNDLTLEEQKEKEEILGLYRSIESDYSAYKPEHYRLERF